MAEFLPTLPIADQLQAIYIGYYGRAADAGRLSYWEQQYASLIASGHTVDQTLTIIANSFAVQAETVALYPELAGGISSLTTAQLTSLVNQIYVNVFGATNSGASYWVGQLKSGAVSLGSAVVAIENGATGVDATVLNEKIQVADYFTTNTASAGMGLNGVNSTFITEARDVVLFVTSAATIPVAEAAINAFIANGGTALTIGQTFTGTVNQDTFAGTGATYNFPLSTGLILGTTTPAQTLTSGDSVIDNGAIGGLNSTLNVTLAPILPVLSTIITNLTIQGVETWNFSNTDPLPVTVFLVGHYIPGQSGMQAPVTLNYSNSLGSLDIGSFIGNQPVGMNSVLGNLQTINVTNDAYLFGYQYLSISLAAANFAGGAQTLTVNASAVSSGGLLVNNANHAPPAFGVIAGPTTGTVGYATWDINSTGGGAAANANGTPVLNNNLALGAESATNATTLTITDDGAGTGTFIQTSFTNGSGAGNWANLTTIDATGTSGQLTISGGEFGPSGLLYSNTTALTSVKGGSGPDVFDLSILYVEHNRRLPASPSTVAAIPPASTVSTTPQRLVLVRSRLPMWRPPCRARAPLWSSALRDQCAQRGRRHPVRLLDRRADPVRCHT